MSEDQHEFHTYPEVSCDASLVKAVESYDISITEIGLFDAIDKHMHEGAFYVVDGTGRASGRWEGIDGIKRFYETFTGTGEVDFEPTATFGGAGQAIVQGLLFGKKEGGSFETEFLARYDIRDGKIASLRIFLFDPEGFSEYFA